MKTKYKYIEFVKDVQLKGHDRWTCRNKRNKSALAAIFYYPRWREYTAVFNPNAVFNDSCLQDIADFLGQLRKHSGS